MRYLDQLTNDPAQQYTLIGDNGEQIPFFLRYLPREQTWIFNISYNDFVLNGAALKLSPNILRQWKNIIPFGLAVLSTDNYESYYTTDFVTKRIQLFLLNSAEVAEIEKEMFE